jgi:zinc-finger binding domain of transposase IS66
LLVGRRNADAEIGEPSAHGRLGHHPSSIEFGDDVPVCPCCGDERLHKIGENVTETLELMPRHWKVIAHVREKFSCRACEAITQALAPHLHSPWPVALWQWAQFSVQQPRPRS